MAKGRSNACHRRRTTTCRIRDRQLARLTQLGTSFTSLITASAYRPLVRRCSLSKSAKKCTVGAGKAARFAAGDYHPRCPSLPTGERFAPSTAPPLVGIVRAGGATEPAAVAQGHPFLKIADCIQKCPRWTESLVKRRRCRLSNLLISRFVAWPRRSKNRWALVPPARAARGFHNE